MFKKPGNNKNEIKQLLGCQEIIMAPQRYQRGSASCNITEDESTKKKTADRTVKLFFLLQNYWTIIQEFSRQSFLLFKILKKFSALIFWKLLRASLACFAVNINSKAAHSIRTTLVFASRYIVSFCYQKDTNNFSFSFCFSARRQRERNSFSCTRGTIIFHLFIFLSTALNSDSLFEVDLPH